MGVDQDIVTLKVTLAPAKLEMYQNIVKQISDVQEKGKLLLDDSAVDGLYTEVIKDLGSDDLTLVNLLLEQLKYILKLKVPNCFFTDEQRLSVLKSIINLMKSSQEEKVLLLCFSYLDDFLTEINFANADIEDILNKTADLMNRNSSAPVCVAACYFVFRFIKSHEKDLLPFIHILPKLIFLPLSHSSAEVQSVAEKTVDTFPKVLCYFEIEKASTVLLKIVKETYCKDLVQIMKAKKEHYVLKVWRLIVDAFGKSFHVHLPAVTSFFQLVEKAFKSPSDDVCKAAFLSWKHLINNLALDEGALNNSKRLRFVLKPFKNVSRTSDSVTATVCESWWHLVWSLNHNLSSRFTEVCIPLLEYTIGKSLSSLGEKSSSKTASPALMKTGCEILIRLLEQPPNTTFGRISSPKKIPHLAFPPLQTPLNLKEIARHFKELLSMIRILVEAFGNNKDMTNQVDCLMKSLLFIVSSVVEEDTKESVDVVVAYINLVNDITDSKLCPSSTCLKCIDILSKLPKSILISRCFNGGICKSQNILCINLLKLLFHPYLVENETSNKRYLPAYSRLVQAGICDSMNPLSMTQKFIQMLKSMVSSANCSPEFLLELWSGIASSLLATIEKTQDVNEGDKQEHDFSCLHAVLLCPFEPMFPFSASQLHSKPPFQLWSDLYKCFIRNAELVPTTLPNETSEQFCAKLKNYVSEKELKDPQTFENFCHLFQILLESIDFSSFSATSSQGIANILAKQKKPLGNIKSFTDLLSLLLNSFYSNFIDVEEEIYQSCTPKAQKRGHVYKAAMPMDILKTFFQNLKSGSIIRSVLEEIIQPISKLFTTSQKKVNSNVFFSKLETLFNIMMSSIEMYYAGPYDSEFLSLMNPLLEACFGHSRRQIKERCRRFWFASFANVSSTLKYPESLKNVMKKNKLPLISGDSISPLDDMSFSQELGIIEDSEVTIDSSGGLKDTFAKPFEVVTPKAAKEPPSVTQPSGSKTIKTVPKKSVDELPDNEFEKISSSSTTRRKSVRKKKSFVPALYNDLSQSQDTAPFGGSSESFDSSCEIMESKPKLEPQKPAATSEIEKIHVKEEPVKVIPGKSESDTSNEKSKEESKEISNSDGPIQENAVSNEEMEVISSQEKLVQEPNVDENLDAKMDTKEALSTNLNQDVLPECIDTNPDCKTERSVKSRPPTPHVRKTYSRKLLSGRKRALSETFSLLSPQRSPGKPIDIIDLSDSEDIIPSSQSSAENENPVESSARTSGNVVCKSGAAKKRKSEIPVVVPLTENPVVISVSNDVEECPETPADLMSLPLITAAPELENHSKPEPESVDESAEVMPLKSSENLLSSEEPIPKSEILSDILKPIEGIGLNVAENTPPLFEDVFVVQSALLESEPKTINESKAISSELKLQSSSDINKDSSKATRNRSARIAARMSLDSHVKKLPKRAAKRKTMFELSQTDHTCKKPKCSSATVILETEPENENGVDLEHNQEKEFISSEEKKELNSIESIDSTPSVTDSYSDDSLMTDVTKVISDIQDKLSSFSVPNSGEVFSQAEAVEPMEISPSAKETWELVGAMDETSEISSYKSVDNCVLHHSSEKVENLNASEKVEDITETHEEKLSSNSSIDNSSEKEPLPKSPRDPRLDDPDEELSKLPLDSKENCNFNSDMEINTEVCADSLTSDKTIIDYIPSSQDIMTSELPCEKSDSEPSSDVKIDNVEQTKAGSVISSCDEVCNESPKALDQDTSIDSNQKIPLKESSDSFVEKEPESLDEEVNLSCSEPKVDEMEFTDGQSSLESQALLDIENKPQEEQCDMQQIGNSNDIFGSKENIDSSLKPESSCAESNKLELNLEVGEEISVSSSDAIQSHSEMMELESFVVSNTQNDSEPEEISFKCTQKSALVSLSDYGSSTSEDSPKTEEINATGIISRDELKESVDEKNQIEPNGIIDKVVVNGEVASNLPFVLIEKIEDTSRNKMSEETKVDAPSEMESHLANVSEGASRKRKLKCPVRSPFNFRQRSAILVSSVPPKKTENEPSKRSILSVSNKPDEIGPIKIKFSHSKGKNKSKVLPCGTPSISASSDSDVAGVKKVSDPSKMNLDELTSMNTRANASTSLQTRRLKLLATSQQSMDVEPQGEPSEVGGYGVEKSAMDTSSLIAGSILKKCQSSDFSTPKIRRVTFSDPLYEELLFRKEENSLQCSKSLHPLVLTKEEIAEVLSEKSKSSTSNASSYLSPDDASAELENSDPLTEYSNLPVSPLLINCKESVRVILNDLTTPTWVYALQTLLESRRIETIGDLCRLNIHELKALPFRSPKVLNLHKALVGYLTRIQAETLEKLKNIDDGCDDGDSKEKVGEATTSNDVNIFGTTEGEIFESLAGELMTNKIQHLSTQTLVSLSEKCFQEMAKRLKSS